MHVQVHHDVFYHIVIYAIDIVQMHKMLLPDLKIFHVNAHGFVKSDKTWVFVQFILVMYVLSFIVKYYLENTIFVW